jgi:hypothetical protein
MKLTGGNRSTQGKNRPIATLSTTNSTWTDPGSNPGLGGERPATDCLSHGTAFFILDLTSDSSYMFTENMVPEKCINIPDQTKPISILTRVVIYK